MQIQSGLASSLYGLQKASDGINQNAHNIATDSIESQNTQAQPSAGAQAIAEPKEKPSTVDNLTSLLENKNNAAANIKALQTQNDVLGNLLDIHV